MPRGRVVPVVLGALLAAGAAGRAAPSESAVVSFEMRRFERSSGDCETEARACSQVRLEYPVVLSAPGGAEAVRRIEAQIGETLFSSLDEAAERLAPELLAARFLDEQARDAAEGTGPAFGWSLERTARVTLNAPRAFSVEIAEYSFTGGAHPNAFVTLLSLDPTSGAPLRLPELLREGFEEPLRERAERRFREIRELSAEASLEAEGFWFEDGVFALGERFAIEPAGLRFYFNSYEIAPYVLGPTDLVLPHALLSDLVRSGGPLDQAR